MKNEEHRMKNKKGSWSAKGLPLILLAGMLIAGCKNVQQLRREQKAVEDWQSLNGELPYLKAHTHNGELYVLQHWEVNEASELLTGEGIYYDINRKAKQQGDKNDPFEIPWSEIALLETNDLGPDADAHVKALAVMTGISVTVTGFCAANPKICFGSCPTIYGQTEEGYEIMAESFSASIAPSMEEADLDMLTNIVVGESDSTLKLYLTNEALETHIIRQMELWAVPHSSYGRSYADADGNFFQCGEEYAPKHAFAGEKNILPEISAIDNREYYSLSDPDNLNLDEWIELEFDVPGNNNYGLLINKRQSLMTTFLLYQGLAYMGPMASWYLSQAERGNAEMKQMALPALELINGIDIEIKTGNVWESVRRIHETGPIAKDMLLVPLPEITAEKVNIRLKMNRAMWRIDYLALTTTGKKVQPQKLELLAVEDSVSQPNTKWKEQLIDPDEFLINMPGARQNLIYALPEHPHTFDYFLYAKGYYLEWMREEWMEDHSNRMVYMFFRHPEKYLKRIAPAYKAQEAEMENIFWNSRYEK